ncbi:MAG: aldo/keto reductase [Erysipelotrichaceae bacterium]|nr:aldo/keto reductase [Erysipelotrichaceae bacterium]
MNFKPEKKFGFGLMRLPLNNPDNAGDIDIEELKRMVDVFLANGFTYFDTAWMYCGFKSENAIKEALVDRYPRDSFTLTTKLHSDFIECEEDRDKIFNEQLRKTGVDFFDYYLLHSLEGNRPEKYERLHCFEWLLDKKEKGLVKHCGFSFHDKPELLDKILTDHPEMEFVQLQINYLDWESEWIRSRENYEVAVKHGKPVIVMEPCKGGTLARIPEEALRAFKEAEPDMSAPSWAIRFVASLENVMVVLSGMSNLAQMEDNISYMKDFKPLSEEEKKLCFKAAELINAQVAVPCTACHYCTEGCPMSIAIPEYFSLYNEDMREDLKQKGWTINYSNYDKLTEKFGKASDCIQCGQCEGVCPQHLTIINYLKDVAKHFEH